MNTLDMRHSYTSPLLWYQTLSWTNEILVFALCEPFPLFETWRLCLNLLLINNMAVCIVLMFWCRGQGITSFSERKTCPASRKLFCGYMYLLHSLIWSITTSKMYYIWCLLSRAPQVFTEGIPLLLYSNRPSIRSICLLYVTWLLSFLEHCKPDAPSVLFLWAQLTQTAEFGNVSS